MASLPEDAVACLIHLVRSDDRYVAVQSGLHKELFAIEFAHLSRCAVPDSFALVVESRGNLAILQ